LNGETNEILFAECKWRSAPPGPGVVEDLFEKSKLVDWRMGNRREYFAVFSKSAFGKPGLEYCREHGVLTFDADQIVGLQE